MSLTDVKWKLLIPTYPERYVIFSRYSPLQQLSPRQIKHPLLLQYSQFSPITPWNNVKAKLRWHLKWVFMLRIWDWASLWLACQYNALKLKSLSSFNVVQYQYKRWSCFEITSWWVENRLFMLKYIIHTCRIPEAQLYRKHHAVSGFGLSGKNNIASYLAVTVHQVTFILHRTSFDIKLLRYKTLETMSTLKKECTEHCETV